MFVKRYGRQQGICWRVVRGAGEAAERGDEERDNLAAAEGVLGRHDESGFG